VDEAAEQAVATALAFADAAGAHRVILLIDRGDDMPALMVDAVHDGTAEVTDGDHVETLETPPTAAPKPPGYFPTEPPPQSGRMAPTLTPSSDTNCVPIFHPHEKSKQPPVLCPANAVPMTECGPRAYFLPRVFRGLAARYPPLLRSWVRRKSHMLMHPLLQQHPLLESISPSQSD